VRLFTYGYGHSVWEVAGFSPTNMPYIVNLFRISPHGEAINYRPYASPSFEVASHVKNCHFSHYYYYYNIFAKIENIYYQMCSIFGKAENKIPYQRYSVI